MTATVDPTHDPICATGSDWSMGALLCTGGAEMLAMRLQVLREEVPEGNLVPACAGLEALQHSPWCGHSTQEQLEGHIVEVIAQAELLKHALAGLQARATDELRAMREAAVGDSPKAVADAVRLVGADVALARRESPWWGDRRVALARVLPAEMPRVWGLFQAGEVAERVAHEVLAETACLSREDRTEVDRRLGDRLPALTVRQAKAQARRIAAELDASAVAARHAAAAKCRRISVRPAPDGMAFLTVLAPLPEVVGAYAAITKHAAQTCAGLTETDPGERTPTQVAVDTALELLSGRAAGAPLPVEIHLVMTDRAVLGTGDQSRSTEEPAWLPGHGPVTAPAVRAWVENPTAKVWLRRLYTAPRTDDLVAMDSHRRCFTGKLRELVLLRDDRRCTTPFCDAPARHIDHRERWADGGATTYENAAALCERCNQTKELRPPDACLSP